MNAQELADMEEGRWLGKKMPLMGRAVGKLIAKTVRTIRERINSAERREDIWRGHAKRVRVKRTKDYTASAEAALEQGYDLVLTFASAGEPNWAEACREMEIHERTAQNLLALVALAETHPAVFHLCKKMGRAKLYSLARLPDAVLKTIHPDKEVDVGDKTVTVKDLSVKELKWYLKQICPKPNGKRVSVLKKSIERCLELVDRPAKKLRLGRGELKEAADKLEIALEKVRIHLRQAS